MQKRKKNGKRCIVRIELTDAAKRKLEEIAEITGMTQVSVMSRMVEWFAKQSQLVQAGVIGQYPKEVQDEISKLILNNMAHQQGLAQKPNPSVGASSEGQKAPEGQNSSEEQKPPEGQTS